METIGELVNIGFRGNATKPSVPAQIGMKQNAAHAEREARRPEPITNYFTP